MTAITQIASALHHVNHTMQNLNYQNDDINYKVWLEISEQLLYIFQIPLTEEFKRLNISNYRTEYEYLLHLNSQYAEYKYSSTRFAGWYGESLYVPAKINPDFDLQILGQILQQYPEQQYKIQDFMNYFLDRIDPVQVNDVFLQLKKKPPFSHLLTLKQMQFMQQHCTEQEKQYFKFSYLFCYHDADYAAQCLKLWQQVFQFNSTTQQLVLNITSNIIEQLQSLYIIAERPRLLEDYLNSSLQRYEELLFEFLKMMPKKFLMPIFGSNENYIQFFLNHPSQKKYAMLDVKLSDFSIDRNLLEDVEILNTFLQIDDETWYQMIYLQKIEYSRYIFDFVIQQNMKRAKQFIIYVLQRITGYLLDDFINAIARLTRCYFVELRLQQQKSIHFNDSEFALQIKTHLPKLLALWNCREKVASNFIAWFLICVSVEPKQDYENYKQKLLPSQQEMVEAILALQ